MIVSEARIAANRRNGALSRGPTSERGKSIASRNSLKSGLTGEGRVLPEGVAETIARRVESYTLEMKPKTAAGAALIGQMALLSARMERAAEHEIAATAHRVRHAIENFDEERLDAADALFEKLADEPRSTLRKLRKSPEGVDRLVDAWTDLRNDLTVGVWDTEQLEQAVNLTGLKARHATGTMLGGLTKALNGDFGALGQEEGAGLDGDARKGWAKARLFEAIDGEIAALGAHVETLDFEMIDLDRAEAPELALFDDSKPACLARRYEAEASRGFFRALREFRKVEAEFAATVEPATAPTSAPAPKPASPSSEMGSFREMPLTTDRKPARSLSAAGSNENPLVRDASGQPLSLGRPVKAAG